MSREELQLVVSNKPKATVDQSDTFRVFKAFYSQFKELCKKYGFATADSHIAELFQEAMNLRKDAGSNRSEQLSIEKFVQRFEALYQAVFDALQQYSDVVALRAEFGTRISEFFPKSFFHYITNTAIDGYEYTKYDLPLDLVALAIVAGKASPLEIQSPYEEVVDVRITDQLAALSRRSRDQVFNLLRGYDRGTFYQILGMKNLNKVRNKGYMTPLIELIAEVRRRLERSPFKIEGTLDAQSVQGPLREIIKSEIPSESSRHLDVV